MASFAIVIGVYVAGSIVKRRCWPAQRLQHEADDYWSGRAADPALPPAEDVHRATVISCPPAASLDALPGELRDVRRRACSQLSPTAAAGCWSTSASDGRLYLRCRSDWSMPSSAGPACCRSCSRCWSVYVTSWLTYRSVVAAGGAGELAGAAKCRAGIRQRRCRRVRVAAERMPDQGAARCEQLGDALHGSVDAHARLRRARARFHPRCQPRTAHAADRDPRRHRHDAVGSGHSRARAPVAAAHAARRPRHGGDHRRLPDPGARKRTCAADRGLRRRRGGRRRGREGPAAAGCTSRSSWTSWRRRRRACMRRRGCWR